MKIALWTCESVRFKVFRLIGVFLLERHASSAGTCESVRLREVSFLWHVRLKRFYCKKKRFPERMRALKNQRPEPYLSFYLVYGKKLIRQF